MKTLNSPNECIDKLRKIVDTYMDLHVYKAALFWADKVVALSNSDPKDVYRLAQCMFLSGQYHRAAHLLMSRNLEKKNILCNCLSVRCFLEAGEVNKALKVINSINVEAIVQNSSVCNSNVDNMLFTDVAKNQAFSSILLLKGKVLEAMDNRGLASDLYKQALQQDVYCFEAFDSLIKYQMLTASEEKELLVSLPLTDQCTTEEATVLMTLYESKMKKYHTPTVQGSEINVVPLRGAALDKTVVTPASSLNSTPLTLPKILVSTPNVAPVPNVAANNEKNSAGDRRRMRETKDSESEKMIIEDVESNPLLLRLNNSLDMHVALAEKLYYNCDYHQCATLTAAILEQDPYHTDCLPIHIACQVELKQSDKLFSLAHKLVDLYPNLAISWFAVGCYYYIIGKSDYARRYLSKATSLDKLFGPAWLAYGHSFANENEHDQAMAAYFKVAQVMKGCHLPLLYIGLECGLTNNVRLADKFFQQAQSIAPQDPFVTHEMGVIAFQNSEYRAAEKHFQESLTRVKSIKKGLIPERWEPLLNNLGHTCRKLRKYNKALEYHQQALLLRPQNPGTYSAIAYVYVLMGQTEEGVDWFHKALGFKRDDTFSTTMLNYVIEQLSEEKPPYPDAPVEIPNFNIESKLTDTTDVQGSIEEVKCDTPATRSMVSDMSIEVEMSDASGMVKE